MTKLFIFSLHNATRTAPKIHGTVNVCNPLSFRRIYSRPFVTLCSDDICELGDWMPTASEEAPADHFVIRHPRTSSRSSTAWSTTSSLWRTLVTTGRWRHRRQVSRSLAQRWRHHEISSTHAARRHASEHCLRCRLRSGSIQQL